MCPPGDTSTMSRPYSGRGWSLDSVSLVFRTLFVRCMGTACRFPFYAATPETRSNARLIDVSPGRHVHHVTSIFWAGLVFRLCEYSISDVICQMHGDGLPLSVLRG